MDRQRRQRQGEGKHADGTRGDVLQSVFHDVPLVVWIDRCEAAASCERASGLSTVGDISPDPVARVGVPSRHQPTKAPVRPSQRGTDRRGVYEE